MSNNLFIQCTAILLLLALNTTAQAQRALTPEDLFQCRRITEATVSPDGNWIAFTLQTVDLANNSSQRAIYLLKPDGSDQRQFTPAEYNSWAPQWSPDSKRLAFLSSRNGSTQIFIQDLDSIEAQQLTRIYPEVSSFTWSPTGQKIALVARVYPDLPDFAAQEQRDKERAASPVKARVYERLLFRHWDSYWDYKRNHIFCFNLQDSSLVDLTPGDYDAPPIALGSGYVFSPDEQYLIFTSNHDPEVAISTNNDLWSVPLTGGEATLITNPIPGRDFRGNDYQPQFSPFGKYLAFLSMARAGFEADKRDLYLWEHRVNKFYNLTKNLDIHISNYLWHPNSTEILLQIDERGRQVIKTIDVVSKTLQPLVTEGYNSSLSLPKSGNFLVYLHQRTTYPPEIWVYDFKTRTNKPITNFNQSLLQDIAMNPVEDLEYTSKDGQRVHGFLIKPPFFKPDQKYPAVFMIHGGPQGAWHDSWHYRWNLQLWAAQGYVIIALNPRGSTGYGQRFTDEISRDWGGRVVQDIVAGQKFVVEQFPFIDRQRLAAAGASYGGYMINFIEGNMDDFAYPFQTLICHDGSFNIYSKMLTTEELWFPEWEFGGPFWENPTYYEKFSPHKFVKYFKTPMLIIHGEKDYRLDPAEGIQVFTALRRQGIPAKLVLFPDEGHWVQKPQNSLFWHQTVFDWLRQYLKP